MNTKNFIAFVTIGFLILFTIISTVYLSNKDIYEEKQENPITSITELPLTSQENPEEQITCDNDAKLCSDGSYVKRSGKNCEFNICPTVSIQTNKIITSLGGSGKISNITISPQEVISDSRCPSGVQCIWAGTVEVRTILSTQNAHGELVFKLSEAQIFGDYEITLVDVSPLKTQNNISDSEYKFTYTAKPVSKIPPKEIPQNDTASCYVGGCSGQLCFSEPGMASTCEYKEEYSCYKDAVCERQASGQCGWTDSSELQTCILNAK